MIPGIEYYIDQEAIPGGTFRNFSSYGEKISPLSDKTRTILCDPQTSGGLLISVSADALESVRQISEEEGFPLFEIGVMGPGGEGHKVIVTNQ